MLLMYSLHTLTDNIRGKGDSDRDRYEMAEVVRGARNSLSKCTCWSGRSGGRRGVF